MSADATVLRVDRIGAEGDGVAHGADGKIVFLPLTLPGEQVAPGPLSRRGDGWVADATVLAPSPDRVAPPCSHFPTEGGACGGCALQHWADAPYAAWKSGLVRAALERAGYADPPLAALARTPPHARRRIDLALRRTSEGLSLGLHRRRSAAVVDIPHCQVLDPALLALLPALREVVLRLEALKRDGSAVLNLLDSGPDLLLRTDGVLSTADRTRLADFARAAVIGTVSWAPLNGPAIGPIETAAQLRPATIAFAGTVVDAPPGAFLQASPQGEAAIVAAVLACLPDRLPPRATVVELFAGLGTLTHPLAAHARILAYESDAAAVTALRRSAASGRITVNQRDLVRQPLSVKELAGAALVVLDPPYVGAGLQMTNLAASGVPRIAYVSCNPGALAKEAALLRRAGYRLEACTPIDQFLWSAQVESVCLFTRDKARR